MRIICLLFCFSSLLFSPLYAQVDDTFPVDEGADAYLESLEEWMLSSRNDRVNEAYELFSALFISGVFSEEEQKRIMQTTNRMVERRIPKSGSFLTYLGSLELVKNVSEDTAIFFRDYHDAIDLLMAEERFRISQFDKTVGVAQGYYDDRRLSKDTRGTYWKVLGGKPSWKYQNGPKLIIEEVDRLVAISGSDSTAISNTNIEIDVMEGKATGTGGEVNWEPQGLSPEVRAELNEYTFETNRNIFNASSALMYYPEYFGDEPLEGSYSNKVQIGGIRAGAEFPQFTSNAGYVEIRNVGEGIDLKGNFEIRGSTVYAIGDQGRRAEVEMTIEDSEGREVVNGKADRFSIKQQERIVGDGVETTIYFDQDSLYHPSVSMKVDVEKRLVQLVRTKSGADRNPFYHSLNRVNIDANYLDIYLDQDSVVVGKPTVSFAQKGDVIVTSEEYFSKGEYYRLQNIAEVNPLVLMLALRQQETGNDFISTERVAQAINPRFTTENIQSLLFDLASGGFITYDLDQQRVRLKPKVEHYVLADRGEGDYDRVLFRSVTDDINAIMNLRTGEIKMSGVKPIEFNREKRIAILPEGGEMTVQGDRDADFDGKVFAGQAVFAGKGFHFKYQPYQITLDSVEYMDLFLPEQGSDPDNPNMLSIGSRIEQLTGTLLLDAPQNKSGREKIDIFPSLRSSDESYIYYDLGDTSAVYNRDSFYFAMEPFAFSSLDNLAKSDVKFPGRLVSGGIFPDIEETVTLQEDESLGFITETDDGGLGAYQDRGSFAGAISLSNEGLSGKGTLSYIGADVDSEDIRFELDRTTATAREFNMEEETDPRDLPQVYGSDVSINWKPYQDSMLVRTNEETPFQMYKANEHTFDGELALTPEGLKGDGTLNWMAASLESDAVEFAHFSAEADTANVRIKAIDEEDRVALKTTDVKARVDFEIQTATFENNGEELVTTLPYNQYQTSIKRFDWDMAGNRVVFDSDEGQEGRFTSIHPDQDSLTFLADDAVYDLNTSLLELSGVDSVRSADATIILSDGELKVEPGAKVQELADCQIIADTSGRYHVINRATVNIMGRRMYKASGFYEYNVGPHEQELELQEIVGQPIGKGAYEDKATSTRAEGIIDEETTFYVDNQTQFQGTINLDATNKNLFFDGIARLEGDYLYNPQWFKIGCEGDKTDLVLEVETPQDQDGYPLHAGFFLSKDRQLVYPSMIQTLDFRKDHPILPTPGVVKYDEQYDRFLFGDSSRVVRGEPLGNMMIFDDANGKVSGSGMLGLGGRLKYVSAKAYGTIEMNVPAEVPEIEETEDDPDNMEPEEEENSDIMILPDEEEEEETEEATLTIEGPIEASFPKVDVEAMAAVDIILPDKFFQLMATDIKSASFASPALNLITDANFYRNGVLNMFPESNERTEAMNGMALGLLDIPAKINKHSFLFSKLKMQWVEDYQSFVSTEEQTGVVSIQGETINKMLDVHVEFKMPAAGDDRVYIYIKSPSELFYFFGYNNGILNVCSNNTSFMEQLYNMKPKDLVLKMEDGETYEILPVELSTASAFLRRMEGAFQ
ncbi:MAG: hypothetical protein AAF741_08460 [Bacteroidota bacterium]